MKGKFNLLTICCTNWSNKVYYCFHLYSFHINQDSSLIFTVWILFVCFFEFWSTVRKEEQQQPYSLKVSAYFSTRSLPFDCPHYPSGKFISFPSIISSSFSFFKKILIWHHIFPFYFIILLMWCFFRERNDLQLGLKRWEWRSNNSQRKEI